MPYRYKERLPRRLSRTKGAPSAIVPTCPKHCTASVERYRRVRDIVDDLIRLILRANVRTYASRTAVSVTANAAARIEASRPIWSASTTCAGNA